MTHRSRKDADRARPFNQRYLAYDVFGERQELPLLHIRLIGRKERFRTIALVDTGATVTFIPHELAEVVGLEFLQKEEEAQGAGGVFANDVAKFKLEILKGIDVVYRIEGEALIPREIGRVPYVVLGRDYIFDAYDITFREQQQRMILRPARARASQD